MTIRASNTLSLAFLDPKLLRLERFRAKWMPVRVKKTRQNKNLEPRSDSIKTEKALAIRGGLPRGFGTKRLTELPMLWPEQWSALGLPEPA
jgi:hypothetical protein